MGANQSLCDGLTVCDLTAGFGGVLIGKMLAEAGALVVRFEPAGGDPFYRHYPAYAALQARKEIRTYADADVRSLIAQADVVLLGGEDHPDLPARLSAEQLTRQNPALIVLDIQSDLLAPHRPGTELLAQARSGLAWEQFSGRPIIYAMPAASYGAALQGMIGLLGALVARARDGRGQIVRTSLLEGAVSWCSSMWFDLDDGDPHALALVPLDVRPLIFRCADGEYVHLALNSRGSAPRLYRALGLNAEELDPDAGMPDGKGDPRDFFGDIDLLQSKICEFNAVEVLARVWGEGLAGELVQRPGQAWNDAQVKHNGVLQTSAAGETFVGLPIAAAFVAAHPGTPGLQSPDADQAAPLAGLRVVDLGNFIAGPYASQPLADLGAEVIKIESIVGDPMRMMACGFFSANRGKKSVAVDTKTPAGREAVQKICLSADVVLHNYRPGVSARMGVDAATLQALKPELVVVEMSGYGQTGPNADRAGYDQVFQASSGHEHRASGSGAPLWTRFASVDYATGAFGSCAALLGLLQRAATGRSPAFYLNLLDVSLFLLSELVQRPDGVFAGAPDALSDFTGVGWSERLYPCRDGWIAVVVRGAAMADRCAAALGVQLGPNPENWSALEGEAIGRVLRGLSVDQAAAMLTEADVWIERCPAGQRQRLLNDARMQGAGLISCSIDPRFGLVRQVGTAFRLSDSAVTPKGSPSALGLDTAAVLGSVGYSALEIESLVRRGVAAAS